MEVDDLNYDIDNVDLEEQMIMQDIEEELQAEEEQEELEKEKESQREQEEADKNYFQNRRILNAKNLSIDIEIQPEKTRPIYIWESSKDGNTYVGYVVHMIDKNTYIFNASYLNENEFKLKKVCLDSVKQVKK